MTEYRKKLIEVALPLEEINFASKAYKDRKVGTIRNIHKWFAPMPLPAWRGLLYAALVDDPGDESQRRYHLDLIKRLVANGADLPDAAVVDEARANIKRQFPEGPPIVMDPFCGGGSTLVEAQRLGLETSASDLNPVPTLITRLLTNLLPRVWGRDAQCASLAPATSDEEGMFSGTAVSNSDGYAGFVQDLWLCAERLQNSVRQKVASLYPLQAGEMPIAWLWARTTTCPNPLCGQETVLATSWWLSKKPGALAWIEPKITAHGFELAVVQQQSSGQPPAAPKAGRGGVFTCIVCRSTITDQDLSAKPLGLRLLALVTEVDGVRQYRAPTHSDLEAVDSAQAPDDAPTNVPAGDGGTRNRFGLDSQTDLYTARQLQVLSCWADEVDNLYSDLVSAGVENEWAVGIVSFFGLAVGKLAQANSTQVRWNLSVSGSPKAEPAFGRNDLPMLWDFAETYPFGESVGSFRGIVTDQVRSLRYVVPKGSGSVSRCDARFAAAPTPALVATDPPYFEAIGYADLSDYFYVWHRRALRRVHADLYTTVAAPKNGELTALATHHQNSRLAAREYFIQGFTETFRNLQNSMHPELPMIVVYASKEQRGGAEETRWSSILTAVIDAELEITGTWPIHGTTAARLVGNDANTVASYVAMTLRPRSQSSGTCSLQEFNRQLRRELTPAIRALQSSGILPVDLPQAALGPGMQVYSRYRMVLDQSGRQLPVEAALTQINHALAEVMDEQEGELDSYSRFAVVWWEKHGWNAGPFGEADKIARPQGLSVDDIIRSGVARSSSAGWIQLQGEQGISEDWSPDSDAQPTAWEAVHQLARHLIDGDGLAQAGALMGSLGPLRETAQGLVYRVHAIAARKGWTKDQERYNALIGSWTEMLAEAGRGRQQGGLF